MEFYYWAFYYFSFLYDNIRNCVLHLYVKLYVKKFYWSAVSLVVRLAWNPEIVVAVTIHNLRNTIFQN